MPNLFVIAGPNGAGKSTSAPELLSGARKVAEFVNADAIQKDAGVSEIEAGRITLARLTALAEQCKDMAFETTLASHLLMPRIERMQSAGYQFHLLFFWLPSAEMAIRRVAARVASGGHDIPDEVVRRRYERGLDNFFNHYSAIATSWTLFNNTERIARKIASRDVGEALRVEDNVLWQLLVTRHMKPRTQEELTRETPQKLWTSDDLLAAVNRAVTAALKRHKERGESVVMWRDGKAVIVPPAELDA